MWYDLFTTSTFWLIFTGIALVGYGLVRKSPLRKLPILNKKKTMLYAGILGLLLTTGILGGLGFGSISSVPVAGAITVTDLQVTTTFLTDASGSLTENSNIDDLMDCRFTDDQANETADIYEVDTGKLTVTRSGDLSAASCTVRCIMPANYANETDPTALTYNILEKNNLGVYECYLADASAATTSSQKETIQLSFAEGVATETLGIALEVSEQGHDALNQYSYKDVIIDVCGKPYTFRIHKM